MKTSIAIIISSIILSIAIVFCTNKILSRMFSPASFPSSLTVTTNDGDFNSSSDFISFYEATAYLRLDEVKLNSLIRSGKLNGTFTNYNQNGSTGYIFSSSRLTDVMKNIIENEETLE